MLQKFSDIKGDYGTVEDAAKAILKHALEAPISAIASNSGESPERVMRDVKDKKGSPANPWIGFNADTNQVGNLKEFGIIDPLKVTKTAFINALSVASNYLVIGTAVTDIPKKDDAGPSMGGMPGGMGMGM